MLVFLLHYFGPALERLEFFSAGDSRVFLTARIALASLSGFLLALLLGPLAIHWLKRHARERIASGSERLDEMHQHKQSTPTMGGIFILGAVLVATLMWGDLSSLYVLSGLAITIMFGVIGGIDDWVKLSTQTKGLTARQKFGLQCIAGLLIVALLYWQLGQLAPSETFSGNYTDLFLPWRDARIALGWLFLPWALFVLVGSSNAVNLTDGLDGLAGGCMVFAGTAFVALTYLAGHRVMAGYLHVPYVPGSGELGVVMGATVGAVLGFLWFNCHPAEVFMGDTGSLPLGGLIGYAGLVTRQECLLVIVGGIFVIETVSVMAQVFWFRRTGRRILACSPLHNHYLFRGYHEMKIVVRFWITAALLTIIALASLKLR
ncbi:MAG: mraY [Planctomycetaceae bacterium]|nr:mraY [Planctomycetaceae bacterium]